MKLPTCTMRLVYDLSLVNKHKITIFTNHQLIGVDFIWKKDSLKLTWLTEASFSSCVIQWRQQHQLNLHFHRMCQHFQILDTYWIYLDNSAILFDQVLFCISFTVCCCKQNDLLRTCLVVFFSSNACCFSIFTLTYCLWQTKI